MNIKMSFIINSYCAPKYSLPNLTVKLIGHYSIDGNSQYHADLSQLKYYISPPDPNNVNYDLTEGFASTRFKSGIYAKLDHVLRWISHNFNRLERPLSTKAQNWWNIDFVCHRGTLQTLLCCQHTYSQKEWIICASKYDNTIYLCNFFCDNVEKCINPTIEDIQLKFQKYKFNQYIRADHPAHEPNISVPVNECEEFHCIFKAQFDTYSLLYEAKMDGISSEQPITDTLVNKSIKFIEIKTLKFDGDRTNMYSKINSNNILKWWSHSYLMGHYFDSIVCGVKDATNTVKNINKYSIVEMLKLSRIPLNLGRHKKFCKEFLKHVKDIVTKDYNESMYIFYWNSREKWKVHYTVENPANEMAFLNDEFIEIVKQHKSTL